MRARTFGLLFLIAFVPLAHADTLSDYDSFRCIKEIGLFEYSRLTIYNTESIPKQFGYQPTEKAQFACELLGGVRVVVTGSSISISKNHTTVFSGPKVLPLIRVFAGPESIDLAEFCFWRSGLGDDIKFPKPGGCVVRGFSADRANGVRSPIEVIRIIEQGNDP